MTDYSIATSNELFEYISQISAELYSEYDWSGLRTGSFEWLMAQVTAATGALILKYLNLRAKNAYISTAIIRQDIRNIAANLGLFPIERAGATVTLTITASDDVTIPLGTQFSTDNGEIFATTAELVLSSATALTGSVEAIHSSFYSMTYRSLGNKFETISLGKDDVLVSQLNIIVNGDTWTKVDNWSASTSVSRHWTVKFDERNRVSVVFGDGVYGARLPADATVILNIYYGGGPAGNAVGAASITSLLDSFNNSGNVTTITNTSAPSGGRGADSLDTIANAIPAQLRSISGLVNKEDIAATLRAELSWLADASVEQGFTTASGLYIPTATVYAYPYSNSITGMSAAQSSELAALLDTRGVIGINWGSGDAYGAPLELELDVKLQNRALQATKEQEIKNAITYDSGAPFEFSSLRFDREVFASDLVNAVESIDGVSWARINKLSCIPQVLTSATVDPFADLETNEDAEDGYFAFAVTGSTAASCDFYRPFLTTYVASNYIQDTTKNWIAEEYTFTANSTFNSNDGPYLVVNGSSKLEFRQRTRVWKTDQWNSTEYNKKYILRVSYNDANGENYIGYYHIADTVAPNMLFTTENATAPIGGTAIPDMSSGTLTDIVVQIIEDQTDGGTGLLITPNNTSFNITHNNKNSLFIASPNVPINNYSHIKFADTALSTVSSSYISENSVLRGRIHICSLLSNTVFFIYTTKKNADLLKYKHTKSVFTLAQDQITINFI